MNLRTVTKLLFSRLALLVALFSLVCLSARGDVRLSCGMKQLNGRSCESFALYSVFNFNLTCNPHSLLESTIIESVLRDKIIRKHPWILQGFPCL